MMAPNANPTAAAPRARSFAPDTSERFLAGGAVVLTLAVIAALARGHAHWVEIPWQVWAHLATIMVALVLTPTMLLRRRGDWLHRRLGRVWVIAMIATAALSFTLRLSHDGGFSLIHLLSVWTLIQAPVIWWSARRHNMLRHRRSVRAMVLGALLIAGFFTFPFGRLLGGWLFA